MEQTRLEEEKIRVQAKDKKDQSKRLFFLSLNMFYHNFISGANASAEVKTHLKSFICRKLQKEGKLG
jgi:hypothetical protein